MATELVLLTDVAPVFELIMDVSRRFYPDGLVIEWRGGAFAQVLSPERGSVLTLHAPKVIGDAAEAAAVIRNPPKDFSLWCEVTLPFGGPDEGRVLLEAIAHEIGGVVRERI